MKEHLIVDFEKARLREIALKLGVGNLAKKNKEVLKVHILKFSYEQIKSAVSLTV